MATAGSKIRVHYQEELFELEGQAMAGFDFVLKALDRTMEAVESQDIELAQIVMADDDKIDGRYLEVHQGLVTLLATQSPVATDLRLIAALLHVIKNIERMGDQCVNICKLIPVVGHEPPVDKTLVETILEMGAKVRIQVVQARKAFIDRDPSLARNLVALDDEVDALNRSCFVRAIEIGDEPDRREWAMTMLLAARALERMGDNTVDVGEQVAFIVTGLFQEFEDASTPPEA